MKVSTEIRPKGKKTLNSKKNEVIIIDNQDSEKSQSDPNVDFSNLKPPTFPTNKVEKDIYEIYVSKFDQNISDINIVDHIVKNTGTPSDLFKFYYKLE